MQSALRFRAVQYRDMPISEYHRSQETQAAQAPGNAASLKVMGKTGQPVAVDPTRVPTFEDVLQQYKEDPDDKKRVMHLLKAYLQALVPPESAGIVN